MKVARTVRREIPRKPNMETYQGVGILPYINFDLGFFISIKEKVRLAGINAPEVDSKEGKEAIAFIEKELKGANLIVETRKKEKYGRFLGYVYYDKKHSDFEDIIRFGKLLNEELVKAGYANRYGK